MKKTTVSVAGCSLADILYADIDFTAPAFTACASKKDGDGGLTPGKLVFADALEAFTGKSYPELKRALTAGRAPHAENLGGPAIVGAINASQILSDLPVTFKFYGATGNDETAEFLRSIIAKTPLDASNYVALPGASPSTDVLSDPRAHNGKGERTFINTIGACYAYTPEHLPDAFYDADIIWFGATALVPSFHEKLSILLKRAHEAGKINIVSTVFDFINEMRNPDKPWPMGDGAESYRYIDLLIVDWEEAVRLSGKNDLAGISGFLSSSGVSSFVITHGAKDFYVWSDGRVFSKMPLTSYPVSALVDEELAANPSLRGDTTGCGDNFAGGFVSSLVRQFAEGREKGTFDITDAAAWAAASGGFACFCLGGTYLEKKEGEKREKLQRYHDAYYRQIDRETEK